MILTEFIEIKLSNRHCAYRCAVTTSGCWIWPSVYKVSGYGRVKIAGKGRVAHRVVYVMLRCVVPPELELDHLCRVRACVNPDHLEPVTSYENQRRGNTFTRAHSLRTECTRGHALTEMRVFPCGKSRCQACENERRKRVAKTAEYRKKHAEYEKQRRALKRTSGTAG